MSRGRPLLFGEVLLDRFPEGGARLGGAPLNVAVHLAGLGERPLLVSRVGADVEGERALAGLARFDVDTGAVQIDRHRPTGAVEVSFENGEPRFEILEGRAWDAIDPAAAEASLEGAEGAVLYHGVLAARSEASRRALAALRAAHPGPVFVDVNLRSPWTPTGRALELCRGATWIKLNDDELRTLGAAAGRERRDGAADADDARAVLTHCRARCMTVTRGARGALHYGPGAEPTEVAALTSTGAAGGDPVGAGDAFAAVLLLSMLRDWPVALALERASELAAAVCRLRGALPDAPDWHAPFRRAWGRA